jgi:cobalamin biosynthesis Co2+ chelatase CbiK
VYRLISEIKDRHQYSAHTSKVVMDKLSDQIVIMLDTQIDPK